jgi:hypothetical protein
LGGNRFRNTAPQGIVAVTGAEFSFRPGAAGSNQSVIGIVAIVLLMQTVTTLNQIAARVITEEQVLPLAKPVIAYRLWRRIPSDATR